MLFHYVNEKNKPMFYEYSNIQMMKALKFLVLL